MNIIFMSTPEFGVDILEKLNEVCHISLVVSQKDKRKGRGKKFFPTPIKTKAMELGLEVFQPEDINSEESLGYLKSKNADLFVVVAFGQILKKEVLETPKYFPINIHASILPKLRGAAPINRAIIDGHKKTGVSIMKMNESLDTGDVALIEEIEILDMDAVELSETLSKISSNLICKFIKKLEKNDICFEKQDEEKATYAQKIEKTSGYIDFSKMSSKQIYDLVRGLNDRMMASSVYEDKRFKIGAVNILKDKYDAVPGTIIDSNKKVIVSTIDGSISILKIQFPGKKMMDIKSFLAGNKIERGKLLN